MFYRICTLKPLLLCLPRMSESNTVFYSLSISWFSSRQDKTPDLAPTTQNKSYFEGTHEMFWKFEN